MPSLWCQINPILPACAITQQIAAIPVNRYAPFDVCVVSPCMIHSGTAGNIIPNTATISGNMRYFKYGDKEKLMAIISDIASNIAAAYGATAEVNSNLDETPPVVNDKKAAHFAKVTLDMMPQVKFFPLPEPASGSDNYGAFLENFTGFYCAVGVRSASENTSCNEHNQNYAMDESARINARAFFGLHATIFIAYSI